MRALTNLAVYTRRQLSGIDESYLRIEIVDDEKGGKRKERKEKGKEKKRLRDRER